MIEPHDVSLCFTDPGHEVDLLLESDLGTLYQMWEGVFELRSALRDGLIRLTGRRDLVLVFPETLKFSPSRLTSVEPWRGPSMREIAALALAALLGWLPFLWRPLSPDEGGFLLVASQWGPGSSLYGDYWVDRPPVLIGLFALADGMGDPWALRVLGCLAVVLTVLLAALVGRLAAPATRIGPVLAAGRRRSSPRPRSSAGASSTASCSPCPSSCRARGGDRGVDGRVGRAALALGTARVPPVPSPRSPSRASSTSSSRSSCSPLVTRRTRPAGGRGRRRRAHGPGRAAGQPRPRNAARRALGRAGHLPR